MKIIIDLEKKIIEIIEDDKIYSREWVYPDGTITTGSYLDWRFPILTVT